jgi:hypothetical protein
MLQFFETELEFYNFLVVAWIALGIVSFFTLFFITAPYGRHATTKSGWQINNKYIKNQMMIDFSFRVGWMVMEGLSPIIFVVCFLYRTIPDEQNVIGKIMIIITFAHLTFTRIGCICTLGTSLYQQSFHIPITITLFL